MSSSAKALASYQDVLSRWPVPYETRFVKTGLGPTHFVVFGAKGGLPLVLLHGAGADATMWLPNAAALAQQLRVYALDIIGEGGRSAGTRPGYGSDDHARWLAEVLDALALDRALVCGASLGGWLAQRFALRFPQRVDRLALLSPAALQPMRSVFLLRAILARAAPTASILRSFRKYLSSPRAPDPPEWAMEAFAIRWKAQRPSSRSIPVISDDDLSRLPSRTLLLLGQDEVIYDARKAAARVHSLAPSIKVVLIPEAGHTLSADRPQEVNRELLDFFCGSR